MLAVIQCLLMAIVFDRTAFPGVLLLSPLYLPPQQLCGLLTIHGTSPLPR
jgi:hypothetical protein